MPHSLRENLRLAGDYLRFRKDALSRFSIHSPFLFELVNDVFRDTRDFYAFNDIEKIRQALLSDTRSINEKHFGSPSKTLDETQRRVCEIAKATALPEKYGKLLFRLVNHLHPSNMLELGTGIGMSTLYIASAASATPCMTLEGSPTLSKIAQEQFDKMQLHHIRLLQGKFTDTLPLAMQQLGKLHFVFIDGDHNKQALLGYLQLILPHLADDATVVIDDIYWSEGMKEAWNEAVQLPQATLTIDLFRIGILFFRPGIKVKQNLKVVIY